MDPMLNDESTTESRAEFETGSLEEFETEFLAGVEAEPRWTVEAEPQEEVKAVPRAPRPVEPSAERRTAPKAAPRTAPRPDPRKRKRKKKTALPIPAFLTHLGDDVRWYYDIRLWSPLILLLFILALVLPGKKEDKKLEETVPVVTIMQTLPVEEDTVPTEAPVNPEAAALARLADTVGAGRSDNVKTVIMWVAINRSEDLYNGYGQTLLVEIARPNQWQGYDESAEYSAESYEMAQQVLATQAKGGLRPVDKDMIWFVLNNNGSITVRNQFTATANRKWVEKTYK